MHVPVELSAPTLPEAIRVSVPAEIPAILTKAAVQRQVSNLAVPNLNHVRTERIVFLTPTAEQVFAFADKVICGTLILVSV